MATYPIVEPRHGGQLRTRHIYEEYQRSGIDVDYAGVFPQGPYPQHAPTDIVLPGTLGDSRVLEDHDSAIYDHLWGLHIATTEQARSTLLRLLRAKSYDFIQVDHLYLWPLVRQCLTELAAHEHRPKIIYSSQNIEHEMKRLVLVQMGASESVVARYGDDILALERDIATWADIVFAVTAADQAYLNKLGQRDDCALAKNGTSPSILSNETIEPWRPILPADPFAVFVSSAHPPNAAGFFSIFGQSMAFLPPDRKLVIAGGVTALIEDSSGYKRWSGINDSRTIRFGVVDDIGIAAFRRFAHVYVLPITAGGGSNIKTAEALLTGAHVLATSMAFRGFEDYMNATGVYIEDDPRAFRARLVELLNRDRASLSEADLDFRRHLLWESTLSAMPAHLLTALSSHAHA